MSERNTPGGYWDKLRTSNQHPESEKPPHPATIQVGQQRPSEMLTRFNAAMRDDGTIPLSALEAEKPAHVLSNPCAKCGFTLSSHHDGYCPAPCSGERYEPPLQHVEPSEPTCQYCSHRIADHRNVGQGWVFCGVPGCDRDGCRLVASGVSTVEEAGPVSVQPEPTPSPEERAERVVDAWEADGDYDEVAALKRIFASEIRAAVSEAEKRKDEEIAREAERACAAEGGLQEAEEIHAKEMESLRAQLADYQQILEREREKLKLTNEIIHGQDLELNTLRARVEKLESVARAAESILHMVERHSSEIREALKV